MMLWRTAIGQWDRERTGTQGMRFYDGGTCQLAARGEGPERFHPVNGRSGSNTTRREMAKLVGAATRHDAGRTPIGGASAPEGTTARLSGSSASV